MALSGQPRQVEVGRRRCRHSSSHHGHNDAMHPPTSSTAFAHAQLLRQARESQALCPRHCCRASHHRTARPPTNHRASAHTRRRAVLCPTSLTLSKSHSSQGEGLLAISVAAAMTGASPDRELVVARARHHSSELLFLYNVFSMACRCCYPT